MLKPEVFFSLPASVQSYVFDLETKAENSWAGKHVLLVAVIAFVIGYVV